MKPFNDVETIAIVVCKQIICLKIKFAAHYSLANHICKSIWIVTNTWC